MGKKVSKWRIEEAYSQYLEDSRTPQALKHAVGGYSGVNTALKELFSHTARGDNNEARTQIRMMTVITRLEETGFNFAPSSPKEIAKEVHERAREVSGRSYRRS
tara:strand:- start:158 stop:469 length:312 start_codon:yes stop_codon:yes gene_type:complete